MRERRRDDRRLRDKMRAAVAVVGIVGLLATGASPALASDGDVIARGRCSQSSDWKLKLSKESRRIIEVEFEVDQNVVGDVWRVRIWHNGNVIFRGRRVTQPPSGSFTVRTLARNRRGTDHFKAGARNRSTGEGCVGRAAI